MGRHRAVQHNRAAAAARRAVIGSAVAATALTVPATAAMAAPTGSASVDGSLGSTGSGSLGSGSLGSNGSLGSDGSLGSLGSDSADAAGSIPVPSPRGLAALGVAMTQAGKPYEWGGTGPDAYDCSGLVQWAYAQLGIPIGRTTYQQIYDGVNVPLNNIQPGDLIIFREDNSHIGIYAGFGQVWNAYDYGVPIGLTPLADEPPIHIVRRIY